MKDPTRAGFVQRETIIELLTDDEASQVSKAETAVKLTEGEEFIDLQRLDRGVRRANGVLVHMGNILSRKAVHERTWSTIVKLLAALPSVSPKPALTATKNDRLP